MPHNEQAALMQRLIREHQEKPHPGIAGGRLRLHVAVHVVVETQIAAGRPAEIVRTLERLIAGGLDRHEAIHTIGTVASEEVVECLSQGRRYNEETYVKRLSTLCAPAQDDEDDED